MYLFNMLCKVIFKRAIIYTIKYVKCEKLLKGSYDVAKNTLFCVFCVMQRGSRFKHIIFHILLLLLLYARPF